MSGVVLGLLVTVGCGREETLTLSADPERIAADGVSVVELSGDVIFRGAPISDGNQVVVRTDAPLLFESREAAAPGEGETELRVRTRGGVGRAYLLAPRQAVDALEVEASFTTVNEDVLRDTLTLRVDPPPLVSGSREHFAFSCGTSGGSNIGALIGNRQEPIRLDCAWQFEDAQGRSLPHTPVEYYVEAGRIEDVPARGDEPRKISYVVDPTPTRLPKDVQPIGSETAYEDGNHNPRDGLVTVLAVVRGEEPYTDLNGNGRFDPDADRFQDLGEPFLDVNDDGVYDPFVDPALCCDHNGNGKVDGPNGKWDSNVPIARVFHVLWTGAVDVANSGFTPATGVSIAAGGTKGGLSLRLVDRNFNPVATHDANLDSLRFDIPSSLSFLPADGGGEEVGLAPGLGMRFEPSPNGFDPDAPVVFSDVEANPVMRDFEFTLGDKRDADDRCESTGWVVEVDVRHTPAPDMEQRELTFSQSGTLGVKPEGCP